jgi:hypothetical protein
MRVAHRLLATPSSDGVFFLWDPPSGVDAFDGVGRSQVYFADEYTAMFVSQVGHNKCARLNAEIT